MSPKTIAVWILVLWINCFELTAVLGGGHQLSLSHPDGSATRRESVVLDTEGNALVDDLIRQIFSGRHEGSSVAKNQIFPIPRVGAKALKSFAG